MKIKYLLIATVFIILIVAGIGLKMFFKPHADIVNLKPDFKIAAAALIGEFEQNELAATAKYSGKVVEITGKLVSISKMQNGTDLLLLENEMQGISCQLDSTWAVAHRQDIVSLQTDNSVTVKGICKGYLMEIKVSPAMVIK